jgi:sulfonate transport system substrate-binding protein
MRPVAPAALPGRRPTFLHRTTLNLDRRAFLGTALGAAAMAGLAACAGGGSDRQGQALSAKAALPSAVPPGTSLKIASTDAGLEYKLSGLESRFGFKVASWVNLHAGPDIINAFRAHSLDVASNAGIPPIQAHFQGDKAKIVSVAQTRKPSYLFVTRPGSDIRAVADFRGKRLGFSQGQAQGVVLLRALKEAGISVKDVKLVNLVATQFLTALAANQIDVGVSGATDATAFLNKYGSDGAHVVKTDVVDFINVLWAPVDVLQDSARVAAIRQFIQLDAQANVWVHTHPEEWIKEYYVKQESIPEHQAKQIVALTNKPWYPETWDAAIKWEQGTADLLAEGGYVKEFDVSTLFDRRFEGIAAAAVPTEYRH